MSTRRLAPAALALLAAASAARADVVLNGFFHTGDEDTRAEFTPLDPVDCTRYRSNPSTFHLSQGATITAVTLHDAIDVNNADITVDIDGTRRAALSCTACDMCDGTTSCGDLTIDLVPDITLTAGDHTIAVHDPSGSGCDSGNDFGWSRLTLASTSTTMSIMLSQRRHIGDSDDTDDDYDTTDIFDPFYPDAFGGDPITQSFSLGEGQRLTEIRLYRLRDLDTSDAVVRVNGTTLGTLANTGDPNEANPTTVSTSLLLAPGTHTVTVDAGDLGVSSIDDFSWDGIVLRFASTGTSGTPGWFNAVDIGANVLTGSIQTKVAGGAFTLDLYALSGFGTGQDTTYNGVASVEVLDATGNSGSIDIYGCRSSWSTAQSLGDVIFVGGTAQVTGAFLDAGLKEARIKVTDLATSASGCSLDNFAIRPASFSVAPSQGSETAAGLTTALTNGAATGLPRHRAGQPFTLVATARTAGGATVSNWDGTPDASATAITPATTSGTVTITSWNAASGGARRTDTAKYSEAGPMTLKLEDTTWANVDADDTAASQRNFSGTVTTGRFVPDHFKVTDGTLTPACALGGFSYLGGSLAWATPAVTLTAESANNTTTLNYEGALETLPAALAQPTYAALTGTLDTAGLALPAISNAAAGVATITLPALSFVRTLVGAFDAEIGITLPVFADDDGIVPSESPIQIGAATAANGIAFSGNAKSQRFGRLYFEPRYGSDLRPIDVPLRAEYFDGITFVPNTADVCTAVQQAHIALTAIGGTLQAATLSPAGFAGPWLVQVSAPVPTDQGTATLSITGAPFPLLLVDDSDADAVFDDDPSGTVTFGLHEQDDRRIYQREVVGN